MDAIFSRRSVRRYKEGSIDKESMRKILSAGMSAPSAGNERPWHFIVVDEKEKLIELSNLSHYSKLLAGAAAAIIVCGDVRLEQHNGYWLQDCSAATENILIEIEDIGLGGVWLGVYPGEDSVKFIQKMFGLEEEIIPLSVVAVGHPETKSEIQERYQEERVHFNKW